MRYIEREGLHPLKIDLSAGHPLDDRGALAHALYRAETELGEDQPFALYAARLRRGSWQVQQVVEGHKPPFDQAIQAGELVVELNRRLNPTFGGCWILALGQWVGPSPGSLLLGPDGSPLEGAYDTFIAWWMDADADRPWFCDYEGLAARGFPPIADVVESCAKGDARYDAFMRDVEIEGRHMARKTLLGETLH